MALTKKELIRTAKELNKLLFDPNDEKNNIKLDGTIAALTKEIGECKEIMEEKDFKQLTKATREIVEGIPVSTADGDGEAAKPAAEETTESAAEETTEPESKDEADAPPEETAAKAVESKAEKPKTKAKKPKSAKPKTEKKPEKKSAKPKAEKKSAKPKVGVVASIVEILRGCNESTAKTKEEILADLKRIFPDRGDKMMSTIRAQVPWHLCKAGLDVRKNEQTGGFYIK